MSILIPNWNGRAFLARCIAATLQSAQESGFEYECIVIDDASSDGSADVVERDFRQARLIRKTANGGFGPTMNEGAKAASGEFLVCLNNDLVPKSRLVHELIQPLVNDAGLFGVSGKTIDWNGGAPNHVNMAARWENGKLRICHANSDKPTSTMFLQGGCCSLRREEFLRLGGFNDLYAPGYWEDYDISYAALKAGWKHLYNPAALAYHFGGGSMGRALGEDRLNAIKLRNRHLFALVNLTNNQMLQQCCNGLPSELAFSKQPRLKVRLKGLLSCVERLPELLRIRQQRASFEKRSDAGIFAEFAHHGTCE